MIIKHNFHKILTALMQKNIICLKLRKTCLVYRKKKKSYDSTQNLYQYYSDFNLNTCKTEFLVFTL